MEKVSGVNICGFIDGEFGLGEGVRGTIRALETQAIPVAINNMDIETAHRQRDKRFPNISSQNPHSINIIQLNGDMMLSLQLAFGADYLKDKYNIGYWSWELPDFPIDWTSAGYMLDEIWTPSNFCVEAVAQRSSVPILRMPHPINVPETALTRRQLNLPQGKYVFLFMFDFLSVFERKNPLAVVEAFRQAFGNRDDVLLFVKSINGKLHNEKLQALGRAAGDAKNIKFFDGVWNREDVWGLIRNCDCYVSLHRAEGFGLSIAESMFCGKPVIATGYSGNAEYMNINNSFPVRYRLEKIQSDCGHYKKGNVWAEPNTQHAAELMRRVVEFPEEAKQVGERAARDLKKNLGTENIGDRMRCRLEYINYLCDGFQEITVGSEKHTQFIRNELKVNNQSETIAYLENRIKMMEASRFWKLRREWFKLKNFWRNKP